MPTQSFDSPGSPRGSAEAAQLHFDREVARIFDQIIDAASGDRAGLLDGLCAGDARLRAEVARLLEAHDRAETGALFPHRVAGSAGAAARAPTEASPVGVKVPDVPSIAIPNLRVLGPLGEGGMGVVYLVEQTVLQRKAALKVLHPDVLERPDMVRRFINEARAAASIRHPNIVDVIDVGYLASTGAPYILMELLEGETLEARLQRGILSQAEAIQIALTTATTLAAAHAKGVVHRDLKPENIFLVGGPGDRGATVKILDFGIAKLHTDARGTAVKTQAGAVYGTPFYMSLEQWRDSSTVDERTDIYALGVILYRMVTGQFPFAIPENIFFLPALLQTTLPKPPREHLPGMNPALQTFILRALAREPKDRFASMREVASWLGALALQAGPAPGSFPSR